MMMKFPPIPRNLFGLVSLNGLYFNFDPLSNEYHTRNSQNKNLLKMARDKAKPKTEMVRATKKPGTDVLNPQAVRRMCLRSGVLRHAGSEIGTPCEDMLHDFLNAVVMDAVSYTVARKKKTIGTKDIDAALRRYGQVVYGA